MAIIDLRKYRVNAQKALQICGYIHRPKSNDWIYEIDDGRWHAHIIGNKEFSLHFDVWTERGKNKKHFTMPMPMHESAEKKRILYRKLGKYLARKHGFIKRKTAYE